MVKPTIVLWGTRVGAPWHPLGPVEADLVDLLQPRGPVAIVDETQPLELAGARLLVSYVDLWDRPVPEPVSRLVLDFIENGGGLLVLHNGISLQARPDLAALIGGRFLGHPEATGLGFRLIPGPIPTPLVPPTWTQFEEPYRFERDPGTTTLAEYRHEGVWYPAAWVRSQGRGQVAYLMPGHTVEAFRHPAYRLFVESVVGWLMGPR